MSDITVIILQQLTASLWQIFIGITLIWLQKYFDDRR